MGLLGLAGNYKKIDLSYIKKSLIFVLNNYDIVDLSTDYGIDHNLVNVLKEINYKNIKSRFIYKIGCEYDEAYLPDELIVKAIDDISYFGIDNIHSILFHRPNYKKIKSDIKVFKSLKEEYKNISFGICTNSYELYESYNNEIGIDKIQIALNPLDYRSNLGLLDALMKRKISIQVRSVLSNGLISGKYHRNSTFTDTMRARLNKVENRDRYKKRIEMSENIINFIKREFLVPEDEIPIFLYSFFDDLSNIEFVIRGSSNLEQMKKNLHSVIINNNQKRILIDKMENEWGCEYV
tara:strand:+ start:1464 stop:2345 length:882 start_codon:yes stop_codon:yes gene_type:complete